LKSASFWESLNCRAFWSICVSLHVHIISRLYHQEFRVIQPFWNDVSHTWAASKFWIPRQVGCVKIPSRSGTHCRAGGATKIHDHSHGPSYVRIKICKASTIISGHMLILYQLVSVRII
jgi:hypothetical protein